MYTRILLSLDGSAEAEAVLPEVERMLRLQPSPATVILVRIGPPVDVDAAVREMKRGINLAATSGVPDVPSDEYALLNHATELEIQHYLDQIGERLQALGAAVVTEISFRNPASEILYFAHYHKADLIVMATHGRRGLNRLLHGSVTETVMESAPCPMLIVRVPTGGNAERLAMPHAEAH